MAEQNANTQQKNSPIVTGFHFLGLITSGILTFMGTNYMFYGNIWIASFIALFSLIICYIIIDRLCFFKKQQQRDIDYTPEIVLGIVFTTIAIILMVIHHHYIDTDFNRKDEIKNAGLDKIKNLENLKLAYDQAVNAKVSEMKTNVASNYTQLKTADRRSRIEYVTKLKELLGKAVDEVKLLDAPAEAETDITNAIKKKEKTINQIYEQDNLHKEYEEYTKKAQSVFENWSRTKLAYYFYDIDKMYANMHKEYKNKMKEFGYKDKIETKNTINITNPVESFTGASIIKILITFIVASLINLCIFIPYLSITRPDASNGLIRKKGGNNRNIQGNITIQ